MWGAFPTRGAPVFVEYPVPGCGGRGGVRSGYAVRVMVTTVVRAHAGMPVLSMIGDMTGLPLTV